MSNMTIRIPEEMKHDLEVLSRAENQAVSDVVREALRRFIAVRKFRSLRSRVLPFAEAQGLLTDDDIFAGLK